MSHPKMEFVYHNNRKNKSYTWMLVDLDHIVSRHYTGLKNHYQKTEPEKYHQGYQWETDKNFLNELQVQILNKIKRITSINMVNPNRVILITDDIQSETTDWIWRAEIWSDWALKFNNDFYNIRMGSIQKKILNSTTINHFKKAGYTYFKEIDFEADDVIAIIVRSISQKYPQDNIKIVSKDSDFYQLINDQVTILNLDGLEEKDKYYPTGQENLWFTIIAGRMSNKVPGLKFRKDLLLEHLKEYYDQDADQEDEGEYRRLSRQEQHHLVTNLAETQAWIKNTPDLIENKQHLINHQVLDFQEIPIQHFHRISKAFWDKYNGVIHQKPVPPTPKKEEKRVSQNPFALLMSEEANLN